MAARGKIPAVSGVPEEVRRRTGQALQRRRSELGFPARPAFAAATGLNIRMITDIENGYRDTFQVATMQQIAGAYAVTYGSLTGMLREETGALEPMAPGVTSPAAGSPPIGDAARVAADLPYANEIWRRLLDLRGRGITDPTGEQLFPRPGERADAEAWDRWAADLWPLEDRVWLAADVRRDTAAPRAGESRAG